MPSNQKQITEQTKFAYSPLKKAFEKRTKKKKQVGSIKSLRRSYKKDTLKQTEGIFLQNLKSDLIWDNLKILNHF